MDLPLDKLRDLIDTLHAGQVNEFEYEDETLRVRIALGKVHASSTGEAAAATPAPAALAPAPPAASSDDAADIVYIASPLVGTFYRAPAPGAEPFVKSGQVVSKGQTLCIVEAMKLMNEIESELAGTIVEIMIENGSTVEFGQRLFKIRKS
jgi:acetyl-CoA carboxylase biotin carboxyl carrier protein